MAYDIYWDKVVLAMHMDDTGLTDVKGHTVTLNGNAARSATQSKFGGYSAAFDGSGDYLSVATDSALTLTSGDFTVECFFYCTALTAGTQDLLNKDGVNAASYSQYGMSVTSAGKLSSFIGNGNGTSPTGTTYTGTTAITLNVWNHAALVKVGTTILLFLNGSLEATGTAASMFEGNKPLLIGYQASQPTTAYFNGYIDDVRITKGAARYIAPFTPPTATFAERLPAVSGVVRDSANNLAQRLVRVQDRGTGALLGQAVSNPTTGAYSVSLNTDKEVYAIAYDATSYDQYWDKVVLAMHMDDVGLTDVKGRATSLIGNAARSATQSKFGGYSAGFDGSGDGVSVQASSDFSYGTGDFTVEAWVYIAADSAIASGLGRYASICCSGNTSSKDFEFVITGDNSVTGTGISISNGTTAFSVTTSVSKNAWHHIAATRQSGVAYLFLDGVKVGQGALTASLGGSTYPVYIGMHTITNYNYYLNGYINDVRITKGIARYTADFTVPTAAFPNGVVGGTENAVILDRLVPA